MARSAKRSHGFFGKVGDLVQDCDRFAVPVELSYKGKRAFSTRLGGCVSLLLILAISVGTLL